MTIKQAVRERKRRYRLSHKHFGMDGESYPTFLERELEYSNKLIDRVQRINSDLSGRNSCFWQYMEDMEKGLRIVDRSVKTVHSLKDAEVVWASMHWLKGILRDARLRFRDGVEEEK